MVAARVEIVMEARIRDVDVVVILEKKEELNSGIIHNKKKQKFVHMMLFLFIYIDIDIEIQI